MSSIHIGSRMQTFLGIISWSAEESPFRIQSHLCKIAKADLGFRFAGLGSASSIFSRQADLPLLDCAHRHLFLTGAQRFNSVVRPPT